MDSNTYQLLNAFTRDHTCKSAKVEELINQDSKAWNKNLLQELFSVDEVEMILNHCLNPLAGEDNLTIRGFM